MARHDKRSYELSEAEQRDLVTLIQQGKALPEKYRFILFEDKSEVELVWNGKTRDVCTTVLPFQTLEHIDEPRAETKVQEDLFDSRGRQRKGWTNKLIWGDNKLILSSLKAGALRQQIEDAGGLKLIYIDPPFDVGADFSMDIEIGGETFHKEANLLEQIAYRDTWGRGADSFVSMIYERLILMRDLLSDDGAIYVHCDYRVNSLIRLALDEVFGRHGFVNELIWKRRTGYMGTYNRYGAVTDTLLWYGKTDRYQFAEQVGPNEPEYLERFKFQDERGRFYRVDNLTSPNPRPNLRYTYKGVEPPENGWAVSLERMQQMDAEGRLEFPKKPGGRIQRRRFVDELEGQPVQNLWDDIPPINPMAGEALGYPTQKPEALLERVIKTSTRENDLVADFFCGSGTTAAVAEKLGRKWIATDLGKFGIHTTRKRLIGVQRRLKAAEKDFRAFEVLNLGRYERQAYAKMGGVPWLLKSSPTLSHELVIGIGSANIGQERGADNQRIMGITTVFSGDGSYIVSNTSKAVVLDAYCDALTSVLGETIEKIQKRMNWQKGDTIRLIFHAQVKKFNKEEIEAVRAVIDKYREYQIEYAFLKISEDHGLHMFDSATAGVQKGRLAPSRGKTFKLSKHEMLIYLIGQRELRNDTDGHPRGVILDVHKDSTFKDIKYLSAQLYSFASHSWRSYFPNPMPVTISYSDLIARNLGWLNQLPGWNDSVMIGKIGQSQWFL